MFIKLSTAAIFIATALTAVQAVDVRFWQTTNCSGGFIACNNISSSVCCNAWRNYGSQGLGNVGRAIGQTGWTADNCSGSSARFGANGCYRFNGRSARWIAPASRVIPESSDDSTVAERSAEECNDADTFGFIDESGTVHERKITAENKEEVQRIVASGNLEGLRALL